MVKTPATSSPSRALPATELSELPPSPHRASFERFLQRDVPSDARDDVGLQGVFRSQFPLVTDDGLESLEFIGYAVLRPRHDAAGCLRPGMTFAAPLKVTVRLIVWELDRGERVIRDIKEQEVYFGEVPLLTVDDVFVVAGVERTPLLALRQEATLAGTPLLRQLAAGEHLTAAAEVGLAATIKTTRRRLDRAVAMGSADTLMPHDLLHVRPLFSAFAKLLAKSPLVEDLDTTNPLARVSHGWTVVPDDATRAALHEASATWDTRTLAARLTTGDAEALVRALPLAEPVGPSDALPLAKEVAVRGGALVVAARAGEVHRVSDQRVWVLEDGSEEPACYALTPTGAPRVVHALALRPTVVPGARVAAGDVLASGGAVVDGALALGRRCAVSYSSALAPGTCRVSAEAVRALRSLHLERVLVEVRDTALGCQELTPVVPGATPHALRHLDAAGVVTLGAAVEPGDVLVGRVSPTPSTWDDAAVHAGVRGTVVGVALFTRRGRERDTRHEAVVAATKDDLRAKEQEHRACLATLGVTDDDLGWRYRELAVGLDRGNELPPGVLRIVRLELLVTRDVECGDVLADGRGGRWVVAEVAGDLATEVELPGDGARGEAYLMKLRPAVPRKVAARKRSTKRRTAR